MKINNINYNNQAFNGKYKILLNEKEFDYFEKKIVPKLDKKFHEEIDYMWGKTPFEDDFIEALDYVAEQNQAGREWAIEYAKRHGIKFDNSPNTVLWLTTGKKDSSLIEKYIKKHEISYALRKLFYVIREKIKNDSNNNSFEAIYLKGTDYALNKQARIFNKFANRKKFQKLRNIQELEDLAQI